MVKKMSVRTVLRQGSFVWRVVSTWNSLSGKVVAVEGVDKCKWDLDRYLFALEIEGIWLACVIGGWATILELMQRRHGGLVVLVLWI